MLQSGSLRTIRLIDNNHSEERLGRVLFENSDCSFGTGLPKYKKRKVSAVRDFPPGCGRLFAQAGTVEENFVEHSISKGDKNGGLKHETYLPKDVNQVDVASLEDVVSAVLSDATIFPPNDGRISVSNSSGLENSKGRKDPPRRNVSAIRDFPPFCGRNAPTPKECPKVLSMAVNSFDTKVAGGVKERMEYYRDGAFQKGGLEDNGSKVVQEKFHPESQPLKKNVSNQEQYGAVMDDKSFAEAMKTDKKKKNVGDGDPQNEFMGNQRMVIEKKDKPAKVPGPNMRQSKEPLKSKMFVETVRGRNVDPKKQLERHKTAVKTKIGKQEFGAKSLKKTPPTEVKTIDGSTVKLAIEGRKDIEHTEKHGSLHLVPKTFGIDVCIPPIVNGSSSSKNHDNDAGGSQNDVREILRLFQAICRKLLQKEEARSAKGEKGIRRIDYVAARILKAKDKYVIGKQILGSVPGVEVGDEFHYRMELNIIGLHRQIQGGIDYTKEGGKVLATSIVASGGYADELDGTDVLIYTGQGGNVMNSGKEPEDQKLERGNLALKNSMNEKNPVRVIHGSESSDGKARTYVYDGLYLVKKCWQDLASHGKLVFKFQLERIPGQPELAWKEIKKSKKSNVRQGLCADDISQGKELIPICAINTIDDEKPPPVKYITRVMYPKLLVLTHPKGCDCVAKCSDSEKCSCAVKNGGEIPFNHNGSIVEAKPLVYECGPSCKCPRSCHNRVSQHGIKFQLEIFKTESRGWGVRSLDSIPSGSFICEYIGELLEEKEADARTGKDEYLFDIGNNYNNNSLWDGLSTLMPEVNSTSCGVVEDGGFTIDAAEFGNVGRFINHSCTPNIYAQNVLYDHDNKRIPHIMLFAAKNIPSLQELTYHYNYMMDEVCDEKGNIKKKSCFCGSIECNGRMY